MCRSSIAMPMVGLALLPSPLVASVAAMCTTPVAFLADLIFHKDQAEHVSWKTLVGGGLVLIAFVVCTLRDAAIIKKKAAKPFSGFELN